MCFLVRKRNGGGLTVPFIIGKKMKITEELIRKMIDTHVSGSDKFLVQLSVSPKGQISVLMDGDSGFTISDCVALSRHIEHQLNREEEDFSLEVSSYGVGNPLILPRQFVKNSGRLLEVTFTDGGTSTGRIISADEQGVDVEIPVAKKSKAVKAAIPETGRWEYSTIKEALIKIEF